MANEKAVAKRGMGGSNGGRSRQCKTGVLKSQVTRSSARNARRAEEREVQMAADWDDEIATEERCAAGRAAWMDGEDEAYYPEICESFRTYYKQQLRSRLAEYAADGQLDQVLEELNGGVIIKGDVLTGCDEWAFSQVAQETNWRLGENTVSDAFEDAGADLYDGIDYDAIIAESRELQAVSA